MKAEINKFLIQQYGCSSKLNKKQPKLGIPSFTRFFQKKRAKKIHTLAQLGNTSLVIWVLLPGKHIYLVETHILSDTCFPTLETHIPSNRCSPTPETHIPSDMCSPRLQGKHISLVISVALHRKHISLVTCVPLPWKHISLVISVPLH